ncbi:PREDICTED: mast cell-expressed membrane protein 1 [Dipodomys ordii]|uniref:Mast cell-expressed membrane protein 1 n=1 Tax=Dipodomys ordii TaxID=10020 RepID=A0A1S3GJN7_DIPOR|nr:PREDICTED: mast cell-expressed membrane protein 1 [Dipodomys ordii]XP_012889012.1 PREDICTED: mast cell-expressed membrane protein 1 [Dipodomys ordii]
MEVREISINQQNEMQTAASKDRMRKRPGHEQGAVDPDYENITLTRSWDQPKGPKQVPAQPMSSGDRAQVPAWLHRAVMSLYIFLALLFLLCIVLSTLVLVKNSKMSTELLDLKTELWNVSDSLRNFQDEERRTWTTIQQSINIAKSTIISKEDRVYAEVQKLRMMPTDITKIKEQVQKILETLEKTKPNPS